jgi:hypothetical protein
MSRCRSHCMIKKLLPGVEADEVDDDLINLYSENSFSRNNSTQQRRSQIFSEQDMLNMNKPVFSNKPKEYSNNSKKVKLFY